MARAEHPDYGPVTATLYHARLSLIQAVLAEPKRAEDPEPAWLRRHLNAPFVELRFARPGLFALGDLTGTTLTDARGRRYALLYLTKRRDGSDLIYRVHYDGPLEPITGGLVRLTLRVPAALGRECLALSWAIAPGNLRTLDRLPIVSALAARRQIGIARRQIVAGELGRAREILSDVARCSPEHLAEARVLLRALDRSPSDAAGGAREEPVDPESAARVRLWARLDGAVRRGLVSPEKISRAAKAVQDALGRRTDRARALLRFDEVVARELASALTPGAPLRPGGEGLPVIGWASGATQASGGAPVPELADRLARASRALVPRYLAVTEVARGWPVRLALDLLRPLLIQTGVGSGGERVVAQTARRSGHGWLHPGLPEGSYAVAAVDHSQSYWQARVERARDPETLRQTAGALLEGELGRPDGGEATRRAEQGLLELRGPEALAALKRTRASARGVATARGGPAERAVAVPHPPYALPDRALDEPADAPGRQDPRNAPHEAPALLQLLERSHDAGDRDGKLLRRTAARRLARGELRASPALLERLRADDDTYVKAAAHLVLWRGGSASALLALGEATRADCETRALVLPHLAPVMDPRSRKQLLLAALEQPCAELAEAAWRGAWREQRDDAELVRAGLSHATRMVRVQAAIDLLRARVLD